TRTTSTPTSTAGSTRTTGRTTRGSARARSGSTPTGSSDSRRRSSPRPASGRGQPAALGFHVVPGLVDTSIRVLGQEPLAGVMPTSALLELARILDRAGFAHLEVSGGGAFDAAVHAGVESPWERIRALDANTTTPLSLAIRGRFLVGSRPIGGDVVRR